MKKNFKLSLLSMSLLFASLLFNIPQVWADPPSTPTLTPTLIPMPASCHSGVCEEPIIDPKWIGEQWCTTTDQQKWCCTAEEVSKHADWTCVSSFPTPTPMPTPTPTPLPTATPTFGDLDAIHGPNNKTFDKLNPLRIGGSADMTKTEASAYADELSTPGGIVSRILKFIFPLAGLVLFVMLVWGGLEIMLGAVSKKIDAGKQRVTAAIVGFLLLFASYWIWQILQVVFGVKIL